MKVMSNHDCWEVVPEKLPVIPTMDVVVFPGQIVPLLVLDEKIIRGINATLEESKLVLLLAARNHVDLEGAIGTEDLYRLGTIATIMRLIKVPEGGIKILVQGIDKAVAQNIVTTDEILYAFIQPVEKKGGDEDLSTPIRNIRAVAERMVTTGQSFSPDFHIILSRMQDPDKIADFVLSHLNIPIAQAQQLLEIPDKKKFLEAVHDLLVHEAEVAEIQEKIKKNARDFMNQSQKEFYLREQLRAIKMELGDDDQDIDELYKKLELLKAADDVKNEVRRQISRLERTAPDSLEATVTRNYLDWIFSLPWGIVTPDNLDLSHAKKVLDEDHYGLKHVKDRILDFISVRNLKEDGYAPILCFVGPPGTGKTSLGQSIARSLGRKYSRISLGGVKDEAEIRGHRRTYVGAMPGRLIQAIRKAESSNPVIVIDEIDKIGADFRGDPSAAMLEVLDPHQNKTFYDNYLGVSFDLSHCLFIATANDLEPLSGPLRDRLEIIELTGYTHEEKLHIAKNYLVAKAISDTGLTQHNFTIQDDILGEIIGNYTREAGVRNLERYIRKLCSRAARSLVEEQVGLSLTTEGLDRHLGPRRFSEDITDYPARVGISNGLAWTAHGGEILKIEAILMPGKGKLILTGQLGSVMKESAQAAVSYARAHAQHFGIPHKMFTSHDLHIHAPAGAIPKDGPSAGITLLTAILSAYTKRPINRNYAMTGELNLCGEIMPIGGLKEKILAAKRNKFSFVIMPQKNQCDLVGMEDIAKDIDIIWVRHANEVIDRVLQPIEENILLNPR